MGLGSSSDAIRKCVSSYCTCVTWARAEPTPAKVVQNKNTHLQTASEHPPRPKPVRLLGPTARAPSTSRPRPPRPATSLTVIYDSARRSPCAPPAPAKPRSAAARPRHLPRPAWWPPPAARRRLRDPVPAARRPPPPAGSGGPSSMVHGQSELRRPGLLPSRGLFDRPMRQAPAAHRQKQCVSTASLHKVHLRGRAERGFGRSRVSWRSSAIAFRLIRSG